MYRKRSRYSKKLTAMREAKERKRLAGPAPDYPPILPYLRRRLVITDFDHGEVTHTIEMFKTNRIDCYRVVVDGVGWQKMVGWSKIQEAIRKGFPRLSGQI